jgi:hypothetical protein
MVFCMLNVSLPASAFPALNSNLATSSLREGAYSGGTYTPVSTTNPVIHNYPYHEKTKEQQEAYERLKLWKYQNRKPDILDRIRKNVIQTYISTTGQSLAQQSK